MKQKNNSKHQQIRHKIIYAAEGTVSEPLYFREFMKLQIRELLAQNKNISMDRVEKLDSKHTDPDGIVKFLIKHKKSNTMHKSNNYWAVFDKDDNCPGRNGRIKNAYKLAEDNGIRIAFSSPCFEYWLLLHYKYTTAQYYNFDDVTAELLKHYPRYSKNSIIDIKKHVTAVKHSKQARESFSFEKKCPYDINPYTDVDIFTEDIQNFLKTHAK